MQFIAFTIVFLSFYFSVNAFTYAYVIPSKIGDWIEMVLYLKKVFKFCLVLMLQFKIKNAKTSVNSLKCLHIFRKGKMQVY